MKKSLKFGLFLAGFLMITTGCNKNYCTDVDIENIKDTYNKKTSVYIVDQVISYASVDNITLTIESENLLEYITNETYYKQVENYLTNNANEASNKLKTTFTQSGMNEKVENQYYLNLHNEITKKQTLEGTENTSILEKYYPNANNALNTLNNDKTLKQTAACLSINGEDKEPTSGASLEAKNWGFAWKKGPLQGLITYPIALGLSSFTNLIGASGIGQILSIIIVTFIVRLLITMATFKTTMQQQKMTLIQPEMNAIQVKYQGKTDQASKQRMSQEMMKLYQKYDVHPFKSLLMPFISMPVFICVYTAVNNTAILKSGAVFGVNLGDSIQTGVVGLKWFAIVLFLIMVGTQYVSMKLPQWMQKRKNKDRRPDPRVADAQKQTQTMTTVFFVMIIFMGWMLPTSMTVYWIASSLVSIIQTLITQNILGKKSKHELMSKK